MNGSNSSRSRALSSNCSTSSGCGARVADIQRHLLVIALDLQAAAMQVHNFDCTHNLRLFKHFGACVERRFLGPVGGTDTTGILPISWFAQPAKSPSGLL